MSTNSHEITVLLQQWRNGNKAAEERLFIALMPELRKIAGRCLSRERRNHTLQRTELVNEIFIKLEKAKGIDWQDRGHFFAIVTRMMRRFLIDYARRNYKPELLALDGLPPELLAGRTRLELVVAVDNLLDELEKTSARQCDVVVLMSYLGMTAEETAEKLQTSARTVERDWHDARRWLYERLTGKPWKEAQKTTSA